jgi:hypothetical protein
VDATDLKCVGGNTMRVLATPKQTLALVQPGVQSDYFIKTKFLGEISIEK